MFGKSRKKEPTSAELESEILKTKVALRKVKAQYSTILERELRTARYLKAKGMKSASNYSKIGTAYYLLKMVDRAYARLDDIGSTNELNQTMSALGAALGQVNKLSGQLGKNDGRNIMAEAGRLEKDAVREEKQMMDMLKGFSQTDKAPKNDFTENLAGLDIIESLINGTSMEDLSQMPADAVPITQPAAGKKPVNTEELFGTEENAKQKVHTEEVSGGELKEPEGEFSDLTPEEVNQRFAKLLENM